MSAEEEEILMEIEACEAIYMEDFQQKVTAEGHKAVRIHLVPVVGDDENNHVSADLEFELAPPYPNAAPKVEIVESTNLSASQKEDIMALVATQAEELLGTVMVFTIAAAVQEYLVDHNEEPDEEPEDMHGQMMKRLRLQEEEAQRKQDAIDAEKARVEAEGAHHSNPLCGGTGVTKELFQEWKKKFDKEMAEAEKKKAKLEKKPAGGAGKAMTGRQLFETNSTMVDSDASYGGEGTVDDMKHRERADEEEGETAAAGESSGVGALNPDLFGDEDFGSDDDSDDPDYNPDD